MWSNESLGSSACIGEGTAVLMADGRWHHASDLVVGNRVYGTVRAKRRRYIETLIVAHRHVVQRAVRVVLADGTELIAGSDHSLLTYRGWKHVTGTEQGLERRPHLTIRAQLLGTGRFAAPVRGTAGYRQGYLCGLLRGDGHLGSYVCTRRGKANWIKHGFRLALTDCEALDRAREYLAAAGVVVTEFQFQRPLPNRRPLMALGNQTRAGVERIRHIIRWPSAPSRAWRAGFLAGIFDAEGSCGPRNALRIGNTDPEILAWIESCLGHFGFDSVRELTGNENGMAYIRLRGGLVEKFRFFHTTDPAITRKRTIAGLAFQSAADLRVVRVERLGRALRMSKIATECGDLITNGLVSQALATTSESSCT